MKKMTDEVERNGNAAWIKKNMLPLLLMYSFIILLFLMGLLKRWDL